LAKKLAIVNGNVSIYVTDDMTNADVQAVVDNIGTTTGSFSYFAKTSSVAPVTFDKINGTSDIEVSQAGAYSFAALTSAANIHFGTDFSSKVTSVSLPALTTVTSLQTSNLDYSATGVASSTVTAASSTNHTISFSKATAITLTALPRYGSSLTLKGDDNMDLDIAALASVDADGKESTLSLIIEGAKALNFSKITQGNITATSVGTVTGGADHDGNVTLTKVENAVLPGMSGTLSFNSETATLETLHVIGGLAKRETGATADTTYPVVDVTGQSALKSVILEGTLGAVTLKNNAKLTSVTFTATADGVELNNLSDLETVTLAGKAHSITITGNGDLTSATITTKLNTAKGNTTKAKTTGSLNVTSNSDLTSLTSAFDPVAALSVHTNAKLAKVDFTGTEKVGATTDKATVTIGGTAGTANALNAAKVQNDYEATAPTAPAVGEGSISNESGLLSLKKYLTAAAAAATSIKVYLDTIDLYVDEAAPGATDTETNDVSWTSNSSKLVVMDIVPAAYTGTVTGKKSKMAYEFNVSGGTAVLELTHTNPANSVATTIIKTDATPVNTTVATLNTNPALAVNEILTTQAKATAEAVGVTLNAYVGGSSSVKVYLYATNDSATAAGTAKTISETALAADDVVGLKIAGLTGTATLGAAVTSASADLDSLAESMVAAWNAVATVTNTIYTAAATNAIITITASSTAGSRGDGGAVEVVYNTGTDTTTIPMIGYKIGYLKGTSDDKTASSNVIVTVESKDAGADASTVQASAVVWTTTTSGTQLTNTTTYTVAPAFDQYHASALADVLAAVDTVAGTLTSGTNTNLNYLGWLK